MRAKLFNLTTDNKWLDRGIGFPKINKLVNNFYLFLG